MVFSTTRKKKFIKYVADKYEIMLMLQFSIQYAESLPFPLQLNTTEATLQMFLGRVVLKICSKFTGDHPCRIVISIKLQTTIRHGCSPVNLLHIFRTLSYKNNFGAGREGVGWGVLLNQLTNKSRYSSQMLKMLKLQNTITLIRLEICELLNTICLLTK